MLSRNSRNYNAATSRAFTLIELLTVIAIISILMALLFPALNGAREQAKKAKAGSDVQGIVAATKQYFTEYGRFPSVLPPGDTTTVTDDTKVGDPVAGIPGANNSMLFSTLRAIDANANVQHVQNPRKVVFYEGRRASNPATPKDGFQDDALQGGALLGSLFDPWGKQYGVIFDTSGDNTIEVGDQFSDFAVANAPRVTVGAFSVGKDLQLGTKGDKTYRSASGKADDVISWAQ